MEDISTMTHAGTHMDAPAHFSKGGITIDQIPVSHLIAPAAVIDIKDKALKNPNAEITVEDLEAWEKTTGQSLNGTVVLLNSGWGKKWRNPKEFFGTTEDIITNSHLELRNFPGFSPEAAQWLVDNRNINGIGSDTASLDRGNSPGLKTHTIILPRGLFGLENVANVDKLPTSGALLYIMPMKVGQAGGAPTRIAATFPKHLIDPISHGEEL